MAVAAAVEGAHSGQNHSSTGTSRRGGSRHSMWYLQHTARETATSLSTLCHGAGAQVHPRVQHGCWGPKRTPTPAGWRHWRWGLLGLRRVKRGHEWGPDSQQRGRRAPPPQQRKGLRGHCEGRLRPGALGGIGLASAQATSSSRVGTQGLACSEAGPPRLRPRSSTVPAFWADRPLRRASGQLRAPKGAPLVPRVPGGGTPREGTGREQWRCDPTGWRCDPHGPTAHCRVRLEPAFAWRLVSATARRLLVLPGHPHAATLRPESSEAGAGPLQPGLSGCCAASRGVRSGPRAASEESRPGEPLPAQAVCARMLQTASQDPGQPQAGDPHGDWMPTPAAQASNGVSLMPTCRSKLNQLSTRETWGREDAASLPEPSWDPTPGPRGMDTGGGAVATPTEASIEH